VRDLARAAVDDLRARCPPWASNVILAGLRGSDAHGTKLPEGHPRATDDVDAWGICVQPISWYVGLEGYRSLVRQHWAPEISPEGFDHLVYDVRKFFFLLRKGNPNVHQWLWCDDEDRMLVNSAARPLVENRAKFLSVRVLNALGGYATAQLAKMEPTEGGRQAYQGYMGDKRKTLVDEIGYDVKNAAHCVRLLSMGIELAVTGKLVVHRRFSERVRLMDIKAGEWNYPDLRELVTDLDADFRDAKGKTELPAEPDLDLIRDMAVTVICDAQA